MTKEFRFTASELNALAQSLIAKCQTDGNLTFDGHRPTPAELDNIVSARRLLTRIEKTLAASLDTTSATGSPQEALNLLPTYDLLHRIAYSRPSTLVSRLRRLLTQTQCQFN